LLSFKSFKFHYIRVGNEVLTRSPDVYLTYRSSYDFLSRCDEVVNWFKKFQMDFVTLYFNEPDSTGHTYGPDSNEYANQVGQIRIVMGRYCFFQYRYI